MFFRLCRIFCCTLVLVSSLKSFFLKKVVVITLWVAHGDARIYSDSRSSLAIWVHDFFFFSVVVLVVKCRWNTRRSCVFVVTIQVSYESVDACYVVWWHEQWLWWTTGLSLACPFIIHRHWGKRRQPIEIKTFYISCGLNRCKKCHFVYQFIKSGNFLYVFIPIPESI